MKTVLLEIANGPQTNQRIWIRLGQTVRLGSAERADVVIDSDPSLAPQHLSVVHNRAGCFIQCLDPRERITVNGQSTQRSRVHDGDVMVAGETEFRIIVKNETGLTDKDRHTDANESRNDEAISNGAQQSMAHHSLAAATVPVPPVKNEATLPEDSGAALNLVYYAAQLSDEVWQLSPRSITEFSLNEVIRALTSKYECSVCLDCSVLKESRELVRKTELHRQLDDKVTIARLSGDETRTLFESSDACQVVLAIFSTEPFELVSQSVSTQLFSFRRPNIFATQIGVATPGMARKLMSHLAAVLVVDESQNWQVFTSVPVNHSWQELGFPNQPQK